jgi:hypothetical protein
MDAGWLSGRVAVARRNGSGVYQNPVAARRDGGDAPSLAHK